MSFQVEFTLYAECAACKSTLIARAYDDTVRVEPCEKCVDEAYTEGHNDGHAGGYEAAKDEAE